MSPGKDRNTGPVGGDVATFAARRTMRGKSACTWTLESLVDGQWVADSTTGLLLFPFWRAWRVEYRQNSLVKSR